MPNIRMTCPECGSTHITKDALAEWNETTQQWVPCATYDCETCQDCEAERDRLALRVEIAASDTRAALSSGFADDSTYAPRCHARNGHSRVVKDETGATNW